MLGGGKAPVDEITDKNGYASLAIAVTQVDKTGRLTVTAPGYENYDKFVDLVEGTLPETIPLEPASGIARLTTTPTVTPQKSPTPTSTSLLSPTSTSTPRPTSTPTFTPPPPPPSKTPTLTPSSTPRLEPTIPPSAVAPELVAPSNGGTFKNPITFQWNGSLNADQSYQVVAYHDESGYVIQSGLLTTQSWVTEGLPGDKYGKWYWYVSVIANGGEADRSEKWHLYHEPFGPPGDDSEPTATPPPWPSS